MGPAPHNFNVATAMVWPLTAINNPFVANSSRYQRAEDEITFLRIVGRLRWGMYVDPAYATDYDYIVSYGLILVKGEYDNGGNWTVPAAQVPNPSKYEAPQDTADPWIWKETAILTQLAAPSSVTGYGYRDRHMSTDSLGPAYSFVDVKPRRRARYEEKLCITASVETNDPGRDSLTNTVSMYMSENLRILTAKWG